MQKSPILTRLLPKEPCFGSILHYCGSSSCAGVALERESVVYMLQKSPMLTGLFAKEPYFGSILPFCGSSSCADVARAREREACMLQKKPVFRWHMMKDLLQCVAVCCSVLQCVRWHMMKD